MTMENSVNTRIVVTSMGVSSPMGFSVEDLDKYLFHSDDTSCKTNIDEGKLLEALAGYDKVDPRRMDHLSLIAVMAAASCFAKTGLNINEDNKEDVGGVFSTVFGPVTSAREFINSGLNNKNGITNASPIIFPYTVGNAASGIITIILNAIGFNTTLNSDNPICYAYDTLKSHNAKALLVGGYEETPKEVLDAFKNRTVRLRNDVKKTDARIDNLTEGSAMIFMENEEFAKERNARILMEVCGYGVQNNVQDREKSVDNFGYITPITIYKSMKIAMSKSGIDKKDISLVVSLSRDDSFQTESENEALTRIWGDSLPPMFYIKKILGETFGANDTFALIAGYLKILKMKTDPSESKYALINSYHVGGNCFSVIIKV